MISLGFVKYLTHRNIFQIKSVDHIKCYMIRYDMIYLLTAIGLTPGGSSTVHIYTQTIHRITY